MGLAQQEKDIRILGVGLGSLLGQVAGFAETGITVGRFGSLKGPLGVAQGLGNRLGRP